MEQTFSVKGASRMTEIDQIKNLIIEAVVSAQDAELLDLVLKLLITES